MRRLLLSILAVIVTVSVFGQQKEVDSLKQVLLDNKNQDTLRVATLIKLSYNINNINSDSALVYIDKALLLSEKLNWGKGIALSYRQKGLIFYYKSDYFSALMFSQKALENSKGKNNRLFNASVYSNIGNIYADVKEFDKALKSYEKLLKISQEENAVKDELIAIFNIATVYTEQGKYQKAITYYLKAFALSEENNFKTFIPTICNNLSKTYMYLSDNKKAIKYLKMGIQKAQDQNNVYVLGLLKRNLAETYFKSNNLLQSEKLLLESIVLSKSNNTLEWEAQSLRLLYQIYERQQQFKKAFETHKKYVVLQDSIINKDTKAEFIKRDLTFENEKQQAMSQAEIERQKLIKNGSIIGGSGLVLATLLVFVLYYRKRNAETQKQQAEFKAKVSNTELKVLRAQMSPHFIFNALNSINDFIAKNDVDSASEYLIKFSKIMRQILEHSTQNEISLKDDLKILDLYLQIEAMRLKNKFTYAIEVDNTIDTENTLIPPLILQPFIENSIWHGIAKKEGSGHIKIRIKQENDMLVCTVDDNGVGRGATVKNHDINNKSYGVNITKNRIDIINKKKNKNGSVSLIDKDEGLCVEVKLPLELAF
ncbi:tetratricopeptide repeat-containing sensor histidine kinase [Hwangdonia lutea]|uniref:Tetratricopeptide repeat protein n=1 Tax=Hwangdonia lutea TaxID=3075823 RepID=A0AA97EMK0_9FLAO|nr:tetratricopeptide repeat protein [Hwangdonia sp. SCSIO 19198]WOD43701.1 tetratricopeptide repeat protein [Hwangdonia sp. SCSIO 19198]